MSVEDFAEAADALVSSWDAPPAEVVDRVAAILRTSQEVAS